MNLYYWIQWPGFVSLALASVSLAMLLLALQSHNRTLLLYRTLVAILLAMLMANVTWNDVSAIRPDRSEEMERERRRQIKAQNRERDVETLRKKAERLRFAEDTPEDLEYLRKAGQSNAVDQAAAAGAGSDDDGSGASAVAAAEDAVTMPEGDFDHAYRKQGKQQREGERQDQDARAEAAKEVVEVELPGRLMPEQDMNAAMRWGRGLLLIARLLLWAALAGIVLDYLDRFRRTFDHYCPLPLALLRADRLFSKRLSTFVAKRDPARLRDFLVDVVRKGDTFVYVGDEDPLPGVDWLYRLTFGTIDGLAVRKHAWSGAADCLGWDFLFEGAWFGRACFVLRGREVARALAPPLKDFLALRHRTRARAGRTIHFVWDYELPPEPALLEALLTLGAEANIKLVMLSGRYPLEQAQDNFGEAFDEWPRPRPYPVLADRLFRGRAADRVSLWLRKLTALLARWLGAVWRRVFRFVRACCRALAGSGAVTPVSDRRA